MPPVDPGPPAWVLPDPARAAPGVELLAVGGDLDPATMLAGYRRGLFPMGVGGSLLGWFSPDPRGVVPLDGLHVSRSLRRSMRSYAVSFDRQFRAVVEACADPRRPGGWITPEFVAAYCLLHDLGWAHSVEVWHGPQLAGGLFGVEIGGFFAGESMFHRRTDASKVALVGLVSRLRAAGPEHRLLDVQWWTRHLGTLGVVEVSRRVYLERLRRATALPPAFGAEVQPAVPLLDRSATWGIRANREG